MQLVDSHCHLDYPEFADDFDGMLARARDAGVTKMLAICVRLSKFEPILKIAEKYDNIYCTIGLHPNESSKEDVDLAKLIEASQHPKVIAFGETGLDYHYEESDGERQLKSFYTHIHAAQETGLPLVIHTREAEDDTAKILQEEYAKKTFGGVLHCFSSKKWLAEVAIEMGFYVSFSGIITFKNALDVQDAAATLPLSNLLVETDAPYLAPMPHRGKSNEPAYTRLVAEKMASLRGISLDEVATATTQNFHHCFQKWQG